jgi:catechol 2,3-dioxygenase-like lactoylglutathione lyase family enzyme
VESPADFRALATQDFEQIAPPISLAWSNRVIYFRDPDGNLVNFFSGVR